VNNSNNYLPSKVRGNIIKPKMPEAVTCGLGLEAVETILDQVRSQQQANLQPRVSWIVYRNLGKCTFLAALHAEGRSKAHIFSLAMGE
jgi:hypothetical protein